ncbi:hypothetical protein PFISCL1PPCAC_27102, partial [Pristionchus fissidentatus]
RRERRVEGSITMSPLSPLFHFICILLLLPISVISILPNGSVRHSLTFQLESRLTCFWQEFNANDKLRVSIVSMEETKGLLQLRVTSPSAALSDWKSGDRSASLNYNLTETGVYEICVHSNAATRVSLNIFAYNEAQLIEGVSAYTNLEKTGSNLKTSVVTLNERLYQTLHSIKYSTLALTRDEKLQKNNIQYVERYTIAFILLNIVIAVVQIFVIRRFFKDVNTGKIRI